MHGRHRSALLCCRAVIEMKLCARSLLGWTLAGSLLAGSAPAVELVGRVALAQKGRPAADASLRLENAVIVFEPERGVARPKPVVAEMATIRKEFAPRVLVVPVGSTVNFPNQDPILHNVFSVSGRNSFDLGLLGKGAGKSATFREPGIVRVFCNVHHAMFAYVYVVASPFATRPDAQGGFRFDDLPAGRGKISAWHERGTPIERTLDLPASGPVELSIEISLPRVPPHKNKFGKTYGGSGYG